MPKLLVADTTHAGHTGKIVERIMSALRYADWAVEPCDIARSRPKQYSAPGRNIH